MVRSEAVRETLGLHVPWVLINRSHSKSSTHVTREALTGTLDVDAETRSIEVVIEPEAWMQSATQIDSHCSEC
ncbi:hypothetical protein N7539_003379 [Penicillium diatomitis]|uniref:Uncharacterized protein n=1 Tax=Penicillium diatomitis TaxID=2819901 RepID=A0A9X0BXH7_9EURO|nr:uncharacterized protein N7539_003379 [Penicillium diatomitis]KAJ5488489.1 hypothetical protein N7539_003379 [Penicillium diatomitis]